MLELREKEGRSLKKIYILYMSIRPRHPALENSVSRRPWSQAGLLPPQTSLCWGSLVLAGTLGIAAVSSSGEEEVKEFNSTLAGQRKKRGAGHHLAKKSLGEGDIRLPQPFLHQGEQNQIKALPVQERSIN